MSFENFVPCLHETHSLLVHAGDHEGAPPRIEIDGQCLPIPEFNRWYEGLQCTDGTTTLDAKVVALPCGSAPGSGVRVGIGHEEFAPEELACCTLYLAQPGALVPGGEYFPSLSDGDFSGEIPRFPLGFKARRLLARMPWGLRWEAAKVGDGFGDICWIDVLTLTERCERDLAMRRDCAERLLGGEIGLWQTLDGLIVERAPAVPTLRTALCRGECDWRTLLQVCHYIARGLDGVHDFFGRAHCGLSLDTVIWPLHAAPSCAWMADAFYPDAVDLAQNTDAATLARLPPERMRGEPPVPASDQYALALLYIQARTGRFPETDAGTGPCLPKDLLEPERHVLCRALADDPAARWPDVRGFVQSLAAALGIHLENDSRLNVG